MSRRWLKLSIAGVFILLITAILNFPASLALGWAQQRSAYPIEWQQIDGSIFNLNIYGLSVKTVQGRLINLDRVSISTSKLSLLLGNISTEFQIWKNDSQVSGIGIITLEAWKLSEVSGEILVTDLTHIFPELELFGISGVLELEHTNLSGEVNQLPNSGNFKLDISGLTSAMFGSRPIGSYRLIDDEINDKHIIASIVNIADDNQVFVNVKLVLSKDDKKFGVNGYSWLSEKVDTSLNEFLLVMGRLENNRVLINWEWYLDI